jgi:pyruvate dehydrogenase E1 component alpha subunit
MPTERQTAAAALADKAAGYGMPGVRVDGNDVFAVYRATREAVDRARAGAGPTLVEAVTYRLGPHTSADDPSRYRDAAAAQARRERDPVQRLRRYLTGRGEWDDERQAEAEAAATAEVERAVAAAEALPELTPAELFGAVFAEPTASLAEQRAAAAAGSAAVAEPSTVER